MRKFPLGAVGTSTLRVIANRMLLRSALAGRPAILAAWVMSCAMGVPSAIAQDTGRIYRLGNLSPVEGSIQDPDRELLTELGKLGFVEGRNLVVDARTGTAGEMPGLMQEILQAKPDAIIAITNSAGSIAGQATSTVPIVVFGGNPVELGLAASFTHPGGNITGVTILPGELDAKRLDLLHQAVPHAKTVAILYPASRPGRAEIERTMQASASKAGIALVNFAVAMPDDYAAEFARMRGAGAQALVISTYPTFERDGTQLAALAVEAGLPTICQWASMARAGCLIGYGPSRPALRRRVADQIAHIFRGAKPSDLPIEMPTVFEFAINLKTARALGVEMPPSFLTLADEVIE